MNNENTQREIIKIAASIDKTLKLRVAAYARVSSDSADQLNSFATQVNYYQNLIENNINWQTVEVYADEGISGVSFNKRSDFQRMIADCKKGKIDRIITKSISRFARNTMDTLQVIRELKAIGVTVYFEKEGIDTGILTSENLLTLYSLFAQEESMTISQNCKKGVRMRMAKGTYISSSVPYGYRLIDKKLVIQEDEAKIVQRIFSEYLSGKGSSMIAQDLNNSKIPFKHEKVDWSRQAIANILKNERYIGDMLLQKYYSEDVLPYRGCRNKGELPQYYVKNTHEPIIEKIQFETAGILMMERAKIINTNCKEYPLNKKIKCKNCNTTFRRKVVNNKTYWVCRQHDNNKRDCDSKIISEESIYNAFIRMYNKLADNCQEILIPMLSQLEKLQDIKTKNNPEISNINKQIAELLEQNQVINGLQSKGILDSALFISQTDEINKKIANLKNAKNQILQNDNQDDMIYSTKDLINILENEPISINEFDGRLFDELVEKILAYDNKTIEFELINGLILTERL